MIWVNNKTLQVKPVRKVGFAPPYKELMLSIYSIPGIEAEVF